MERLYPKYIIIHHTAGWDQPITAIDRYHASLGWGVELISPKSMVDEYRKRGFRATGRGVIISVGYHYLIRADGRIERGRPDFMQGAHCINDGMNFKSLGIALTGNFDSCSNPKGEIGLPRPTKSQLDSLERLCRILMDKYTIEKDRILPHNKVRGADTKCPGDRLVFKPEFVFDTEHVFDI
ncbi:MAG: N-acetylmuramoyl-L-alanine amidase [Thermosediminibacterales bacterium]|nr:N-acetylmuramoyl-L-alanine amidase [Thermosediminibacterales bacterium]MDK2836715.1 N-acetylmuramoyl-L-alanine amidase [Thermosediminibacterales bacterium]